MPPVDLGASSRVCVKCDVGWVGVAGSTCWCCGEEGVRGTISYGWEAGGSVMRARTYGNSTS